MKATLCCMAALVLSLTGCGPQDENAEEGATNAADTTPGNPVTAPVDYLGAVGQAKKSMEKTLELVSVNQAIQQFVAAEGRAPKTLNELVDEDYLTRLPKPPAGMTFRYDPATGRATLQQN